MQLPVCGRGCFGIRDGQDEALQYAASLSGSDLAPDATGDVTLTKTSSGQVVLLGSPHES